MSDLRRFWRFRSNFPTDDCDPPLAIVRLRSDFRPSGVSAGV